MREVTAEGVERAVRDMVIDAATDLPRDVEEALTEARARESSPLAREILDKILENAALARADSNIAVSLQRRANCSIHHQSPGSSLSLT